MATRKIILIAGPTASGKSALALEMAQNIGGTIINADAMQIYAGMPILSAQPDATALATVPHKLYAALDAAEKSSAGIWLGLAQQAIEETLIEKRIPILVGGTGLYFRALLGGLADIPPIPDAVRQEVQELYDKLGEEQFRKELAALDPDSAQRLAPNDRQRSIRAYEVVKHTGKTLGEWHKQGHSASGIRHSGTTVSIPGCQMLNAECHLLLPERDKLYAACDARFTKMIDQGAIDEAKTILDRSLDPTLPAMKTIGVRELGSYLNGECDLPEAVAKAQQLTRNYAKRQLTWFRNQWQR